jgi:hypothetical protein
VANTNPFAQFVTPTPEPNPFAQFVQPEGAAPSANVAADVAKSAGSGLAKGAIGFAAAGPLLIDLAARGVEHAVNWMAPDSAVAKSLNEGRTQAEENRKAIRAATGKPFYEHEPETTAGKYTHTVAEFVPAAVLGNPAAGVRGAATAGD